MSHNYVFRVAAMSAIEQNVSDTISRARKLASAPGWSRKKVAEMAGLHANTLRNLHDPSFSASVETLVKLERFLAAEPAQSAA